MDAATAKLIQANLGWAALALALIGVLALISSWSATNKTAQSSPSLEARVKLLTTEATSWSAAAAQARKEQDPLRAVVQAATGVAYLRVARSLVSASDIERVANVRYEELERTLSQEQQRALKAAASSCAALAKPGVAALNTGWLPTQREG